MDVVAEPHDHGGVVSPVGVVVDDILAVDYTHLPRGDQFLEGAVDGMEAVHDRLDRGSGDERNRGGRARPRRPGPPW